MGAVLLVVFVLWQQRSTHPLLPLRIVPNRTRGGSLIALFITSIGIFGISLFLAYYLQNTLGYSPMRTGVAVPAAGRRHRVLGVPGECAPLALGGTAPARAGGHVARR